MNRFRGRKFIVILLALVLACGGTNKLPEPVRPGTPSARQITAVATYGPHEWQRSPWYRSTMDAVMDSPVLLLVATDGSACIVPGRIWAIAQPGQQWPCQSGWRLPRPQ